jgi:hypothetical protein
VNGINNTIVAIGDGEVMLVDLNQLAQLTPQQAFRGQASESIKMPPRSYLNFVNAAGARLLQGPRLMPNFMLRSNGVLPNKWQQRDLK